MRLDRSEGFVCASCARPAIGFGVRMPAGNDRNPIHWICDDTDCIQIARNSYDMKQEEFDRIDRIAAVKGGDNAGAFLSEIGKTDLSTLSRTEWMEFCHRMTAGYRAALKETMINEVPF